METINFENKYRIGIFVINIFLISMTSTTEESFPIYKTLYVKNILSLAKSSEMRSFMNPNIDPCYDFYEFACGNWAKINPESRAHKQMSAIDVLKKTYERKILTMLNANFSTSDTMAERKVKIFYKSCIVAVENFDRNSLHDLFKQFGSMPLFDGIYWDENNFDWLAMLAHIKRNYGLQILIGMDVNSDMKYSKTNRLFIGQPPLRLLDKSLYLEEKGLPYRIAYRNEVASNLKKIIELENNVALNMAEEIVGFEILLAKGLQSKESNINIANFTKETTVEALQSQYAPTIDFKRFLNLTLDEIPNGTIYEFNENYLKNLKYVLETTNPKLLANYMLYMTLKEFLPFAKHLTNRDFCLEKVSAHFSKALFNMIYRKFNVAAAEDDIKMIWHSLRKVFKSKLYTKELEWISSKVRQYAEQKLNDMSIQIDAYNNYNFSIDYANLNLTTNDYMRNLKQILQNESNKMFQKLNKPINKSACEAVNSLAIPFNMLSTNTVKLPVVLLQPYALWAAHYPIAVKFGTLGFLIARALIHGFDDKGRLYNKDGELENWWDELTINAFMARRDCFINQYPEHYNQISNLDSDSENIADNIGLNLAFEAFLDYQKTDLFTKNNLTDNLPYMAYSDNELFFLSFAQLLCNDVDSFQPSLEQHISGRFRVIGALTNSNAFCKTYNCKAESPMNPKQKCEIF